MFQCRECHRRFARATEAIEAAESGCPGCGKTDSVGFDCSIPDWPLSELAAWVDHWAGDGRLAAA